VVAPAIQFKGDRLAVTFDRFDLDAYGLFLRLKALPELEVTYHRESETYTLDAPARFADRLGVVAPRPARARLDYPAAMYDDQRFLTDTALEAKRWATWSGCGNGKTLMGLEFARQCVHLTGGKVLVVTLNQIVPEWVAEAALWYGDSLPLVRLESRRQMREWCGCEGAGVAVVNYEKFNPDADGQVVAECRKLAGVVLDESSRLKTGGGKQKWAIIKSFKGVEYKLSLSATPAPNDYMEFASQAAFLEKLRTEGEILWTYFTRHPKTQEWTIKPHAREAFFRFMSSWSIYVNDPKRYGWRLGVPDVPPPETLTAVIPATAEQLEHRTRIMADGKTGQLCLFPDREPDMPQRNKLSQVAKGFVYSGKGKAKRTELVPSLKPKAVADLVRAELARGVKVLVWTEYDAESEILGRELADVSGVVSLTGRVKKADRPALVERFRTGDARVLVTRAKMVGFGLNFQCAGAMVFSGWTDSFESMYQAVRRAVRHGQTGRVRVHFPVVEELEGDVLGNVRRKEREFDAAVAEMERCYLDAREERAR
jgi:hypothetical protein